MKKTILSLILCTVIIASISTFVVGASENNSGIDEVTSVQPRLTYIQSASTGCSVSNGKVHAMADVICYSSASSCKAVAKIYRRPVGSSNDWSYVASFTGTGTLTATATGSRTAYSAYEYRVKASVTAYASNGASETSTFYSKVAK